MTIAEFQTNHSGELKAFFDSQLGRSFLMTLNSLRPGYEFPIHEHLMLANRESIRGYDQCLRNMIALTMAPVKTSEIPANYGVPDKKEPKE